MYWKLLMDKEYLLSRMRTSMAMALKADNSAVRLIHLDLAGRYSVAAVGTSTGIRS